MIGHVAEIVGHDPETAGHVHPKYAVSASTVQRHPAWSRESARGPGRHLALCVPPLWLAHALYTQAMAERYAAQRGDSAVLIARAAVRALLHYRDATSVLEHAVTGIGYALVGLFVLQVYYFIDEWPGNTDVAVPLWLRVLGSIGVGGPTSAIAWVAAYPGHGPYAALVAMIAACAVLNCERRVRRKRGQMTVLL